MLGRRNFLVFIICSFFVNNTFAEDYNCVYGRVADTMKNTKINPAKFEFFQDEIESIKALFQCFGVKANGISLLCAIDVGNTSEPTLPSASTIDGSKTLTLFVPRAAKPYVIGCSLASESTFSEIREGLGKLVSLSNKL